MRIDLFFVKTKESLDALFFWFIVLSFCFVAHTLHAEKTMSPSAEDAQFELWIQKIFDHSGFSHQPEKDTAFVYVNQNWKKGVDEWRYRAIRRLGCAARTEFAGELTPPYQIEILLLVPRTDGTVVTELVAAGNIDKESCALKEFLPILSPAKETSL